MGDSDSDGIPPIHLSQLIENAGRYDGPPTAASRAGGPGLDRTVEGEIIPRLMMLFDHHVSGAVAPAESPVERQVDTDLDDFVALVMERDADEVCEYVGRLRDGGEPLPSIYLNLLAPAARRLGEFWERDECTFAAVTVGISKMHQVLLRFSPFFCANYAVDGDASNSVLVVPVPGEQHTFGLLMLVEFFRREGWNVWSGAPRSIEELAALVESQRFDVVGCSLSTDNNLASLPDMLRVVRERSKNKNIKVIVGGRLFSEQPELAGSVGADASAVDGLDAVRQAERLVDQPR